jgi:FkbM family methyltransferase
MNSDSVSAKLDDQLEELLAEGATGARQRETTLFDEIVGSGSRELVLFGAGNLGRRTLKGLRAIGIEPVCFLDNNEKRWGQKVDGISVLSPSDGAVRYGSQATFVITVWGAHGTDRMASRIEQLRKMGCKTVVSFMPLYWKYSSTFLPHYTLDSPHLLHVEADRVRSGFELMADEASRREYLAQIQFRLSGDFAYLPDPVSGPMYFRKDLFELGKAETFIDCGAFDGDSLALFLEATGSSFQRAILFEPDPANFTKLENRVAGLAANVAQLITMHCAATGRVNERVMMDVGSGPSSHVGLGDQQVESFALDSVLRDVPVSFVKMDIEGSEIATLEGAEKLIRKHAPILAISAYHRQSDLWNIPLLIRRLNPTYSFHLRPHMIEGWDLVCYAVPDSRRH